MKRYRTNLICKNKFRSKDFSQQERIGLKSLLQTNGVKVGKRHCRVLYPSIQDRETALPCPLSFDTPLPKGEGILASSVLPRIISNPLFGYVHKHTRTARPRLE
jgi:hypothetical protein